jgi:hypothetical protein
MTFSIMTLSITTLSITTFSITILSIKTLNIKTLSITRFRLTLDTMLGAITVSVTNKPFKLYVVMLKVVMPFLQLQFFTFFCTLQMLTRNYRFYGKLNGKGYL